jgi:hypothetical protein
MKKTAFTSMVFVLCAMFTALILVSCSSSSETEKEKKERTSVQRYFKEALDGRNYDLIADLFAENGVQNFPGIPPIKGNKNMVTAMNKLLGPTKSFKTIVHAIVVEGDKVMAYIDHEVLWGPDAKFRTQEGVQPELLNIANKTIKWSAMAIFIFDENGKIKEEFINRDDVGIYKQAGKVTVKQ